MNTHGQTLSLKKAATVVIADVTQLTARGLADAFQHAPAVSLTLGGLMIGFLFGVLTRLSNYCVMGAISDWQTSGNLGRLSAAAMAAGTAIVGTQLLNATGIVDLSRSMYVVPQINWFGSMVGGLTFGAGMVYAGGCPSRGLVRAGSGDTRSIVTLLVMSVAAYATISGVLGETRATIERATAFDLSQVGVPSQSLTSIIALAVDDGAVANGLVIIAVAGPLIAFAVFSNLGEPRWKHLASGIGVGLLVCAGWALTGLSADEMAVRLVSPQSLSFVKPVADGFDWIGRSTAIGWPGFGAASVFGVCLGGAVASAIKGEWRMTGFSDAGDFHRHVGGAVAMGIGGVLGLGCTVGQGVTGISTLAIQSLITCSAIVAGAMLALKRLERAI